MGPFSTPLVELHGVGPARSASLTERGLETLVDLLLLAPLRYDVPPPRRSIVDLAPKVPATLVGEVISARKVKQRRGGTFLDLTLSEGAERIRVCLWNRGWLKDRVQKGDRVAVSGTWAGNGSAFSGSAIEVVGESAEVLESWLSRLEPIHPKIPGVAEGTLRRLLTEALARVAGMPDPLPECHRVRLGLPTLTEALALVHQPSSREDAERGGARLLFDRLLSLALGARSASSKLEGPAIPMSVSEAVMERILARLPFKLTKEQNEAVSTILSDLAQPLAMRRLLLGDVGSGKTAVAVAAILAAVATRQQAMLIAPTDVLANQHATLLRTWLAGSRVRLGTMTSREPRAIRRSTAVALAKGEIDILVGTHVALGAEVAFQKLGLVVVDEQHRFGVLQRLAARGKAIRPHVLALSATPIPRSLALALFGDLPMTRIAARPHGRQTPKAIVSSLTVAYDALLAAVKQGNRAFVVFPTIASESTPSVEREGRLRAKSVLNGVRVGYLHGKLPYEEQAAALDAFRRGETDVLVATSMIEVGVDIPQATVMVVEGADRFGLASLHQLRGRVGRGALPGTVHLIPTPRPKGQPPRGDTDPAIVRLKLLERENDGFRLAEADLLMRGPGDWCGVRQHGFGGSLPLAEGRDLGFLDAAEQVASILHAERYDEDHIGWYSGLAERLGGLRFEPKDAV